MTLYPVHFSYEWVKENICCFSIYGFFYFSNNSVHGFIL